MNNVLILALADTEQGTSGISSETVNSYQTTTTTQVPADPNAPSARPSPFGGSQLIFFGLMFVVMYFFIFRGPRKKQQQHKKMVQSLEKNDRVRTIGGIIGTVVDVRDDEITLKIDESNNTKIKVIASAIGKNMSKEKS